MTNRLALIAGASGDIGGETARRLARAGVLVCLGFRGNRERAETVADEILGQGGAAEIYNLDLSEPGGETSICEGIFEKHGRLDILVNSAAINRESPALGMEDEDWNAVLEINLSGAFRLCRAAGKFMMLNRWGRIINISSVSARIGGRGQINYAAAKAGMERMTQVLALELGRRGITANCVSPGVIEGAMSERVIKEHGDEMLKYIPAHRFGSPADVAAAVAFLASEEAGYINGQTLGVDGGMSR